MDTASRQQYAQQLAQNPLLPVLFDELRDSAIKRWQQAKNPEARDECWHTVAAVDRIAGFIQSEIKSARGTQ